MLEGEGFFSFCSEAVIMSGEGSSTLGDRGPVFFRSEAAIMSGEGSDRGFATHNRSFATKASLWHPGYCESSKNVRKLSET